MMSSGGKECELPTADSCAIMEGEDAEDDLMDLTKKSFFTKIRSFSREVSGSQCRRGDYKDLKQKYRDKTFLKLHVNVFSEDGGWI